MIAVQEITKFTFSTESRQVEVVYKRGFWNHREHGENRVDSDYVITVQYKNLVASKNINRTQVKNKEVETSLRKA